MQTTTINNYFSAPANVTFAAPVPSEEPIGRWLPPPPARESRFSQTLGGALRIQCINCRGRKAHGPDQFVPEKNPRDAAAYAEALEALGDARASKDGDVFLVARETIAKLATTWCATCRASNAKSRLNPETVLGACRAEWLRLKAEVFHTCARCGAKRAIEANHGKEYADNAKLHKAMVESHGQDAADAAYPASERKLALVSATDNYWSCHGGVEGMRGEALKCEPLCRMCHTMDESSTSAPENAASRAKAEAKEYETAEKRQIAVLNTGYKVNKRAYVDAIKRKLARANVLIAHATARREVGASMDLRVALIGIISTKKPRAEASPRSSSTAAR